jgi:hypothetical protein
MKKRVITFSLLTTLLFVVTFSNNCINSKSSFIDIYELLKVKIPVIDNKESNLFSFDSLSNNDIWNWNKSDDLIIVDSIFFTKYLTDVKEFTTFKNYQTIYFTYIVDFNDDSKYLVFSQYIHNGDESNMYLVSFTNEGIVLNVFLLAKIEKSPDDLLKTRSELVNLSTLKTTKIFMVADDAAVFKDSVVSYFNRKNNIFIKTKVDSVRIVFEK